MSDSKKPDIEKYGIIQEGSEKRGGVNPKPATPKPNFDPPAQQKKTQ